MQNQRKSSDSSRTKGVLLFLFVSGLLLCSAELLTRGLVWYRTPDGMRFDEQLLYEYQPGTRVGEVLINGIGCIGPELQIPKPKDQLRVFLLGGSTSFSAVYPAEVQKILSDSYPGEVVVNSCGRPRYTSHTNRVVFEQHLLQYEPDVIALYLGINDNIYNSFRWLRDVPQVGFFNWKSTNRLLFWDFVRYHIIDKRIRSIPDFKMLPIRSGAIFKRNLEAIITRAQELDISVILSTFAVAEPTTDSTLQAVIESEESRMQHFWGTRASTLVGVAAHNEIVRQLSEQHHIPAAFTSGQIPTDSVHFTDMCHMTDRGKRVLARSIAETIAHTIVESGDLS